MHEHGHVAVGVVGSHHGGEWGRGDRVDLNSGEETCDLEGELEREEEGEEGVGRESAEGRDCKDGVQEEGKSCRGWW